MQAHNFKNLTGKRFGRLVVGSKYEVKIQGSTHRTFWDCICDCGKLTSTPSKTLLNGQTKSCGCLRNDHRIKNAKLRTLDGDLAIRNKVFRIYRRNALERNLNFNIDIDCFWKIAKQSCYYCGATNSQTHKTVRVEKTEVSCNGIDRIDNNRGYESDNVVPCCKTCNRAKDIMGQREFLDWISRVHNHSNL